MTNFEQLLIQYLLLSYPEYLESKYQITIDESSLLRLSWVKTKIEDLKTKFEQLSIKFSFFRVDFYVLDRKLQKEAILFTHDIYLKDFFSWVRIVYRNLKINEILT